MFCGRKGIKRRKIFPVLAAVSFFLTACRIEEGSAEVIYFHDWKITPDENETVRENEGTEEIELFTASEHFVLSFEKAAYYQGIFEDYYLWMKTQESYGNVIRSSVYDIPAAFYQCENQKGNPLCRGVIFFGESGKYQAEAKKETDFIDFFNSIRAIEE